MPKYNETPTDKIIKKKQQTNTGIYVTAGDIDHSDYDTKSWKDLQKDYTHMRDGHAIISTTVDILKYPILMSGYRVESKNKEAEDFIYWVYDNLYKGFDYFRRHKLLALDFGLAMHEVVIKRGDKFNGKLTNRPVWFNPIQNETINSFHYDDITRFIGIEHEKRVPEKGSSFVDIYNYDNSGKYEWNLDYYSFNEEFNDVRGRALLRPIRLFWESELKIINAKVTGIQRGAGIPIIYTHGEPSDADKTSIEKLGRTICQLRNGYAAANKERIEIDLIEPKGQGDVMQMLEWLDRQMFFNTLSQFMAAGIGGNGSRSATSEHKSSYELVANYILQSLEVNFQEVTNQIIRGSHLAKIPASEYPEFHFNAITQVDLQKVAGNIKSLMDSSAITKQREDEIYIREMFNMPDLKITTKISDPNEKPVSMFGEKGKPDDNKTLGKERKVTTEAIEFEDRVLSLSSATDHYDTIEKKIDTLISKSYGNLIDDMTDQLKKDRYKSLVIRNSLIEYTIDNIMELYKTGYVRGEKDIKTEINKIGGKLNLELALSKKSFDKKMLIISKLIKTLFFNTKSGIENKMSVVSNSFIDKKGGLNKYLSTWKDGSKTVKNNIKSNVESGYIDGRGETLMDVKKDIELFFVSTRLDKSLCDECAPFDGAIMTYDELSAAGLNLVHPVNPFCLGNENCRCVVIPYKYGRG